MIQEASCVTISLSHWWGNLVPVYIHISSAFSSPAADLFTQITKYNIFSFLLSNVYDPWLSILTNNTLLHLECKNMLKFKIWHRRGVTEIDRDRTESYLQWSKPHKCRDSETFPAGALSLHPFLLSVPITKWTCALQY